MTCSAPGMTAGATIFAAGASATQGAMVSISKKTAPFSLTACKTSDSVSKLTARSPWRLEQDFWTHDHAPAAIWIPGQETRMEGHSASKSIRLNPVRRWFGKYWMPQEQPFWPSIRILKEQVMLNRIICDPPPAAGETVKGPTTLALSSLKT